MKLKTVIFTLIMSSSLATFAQLKADFETHFDDFELFWHSKPVKTLRAFGLLLL